MRTPDGLRVLLCLVIAFVTLAVVPAEAGKDLLRTAKVQGVRIGDAVTDHPNLVAATEEFRAGKRTWTNWRYPFIPEVHEGLEMYAFFLPEGTRTGDSRVFGPHVGSFKGVINLGGRWEEPRASQRIEGAVWFGVRAGLVRAMYLVSDQASSGQYCGFAKEVLDGMTGRIPEREGVAEVETTTRYESPTTKVDYQWYQKGLSNSFCLIQFREK